MRKLTNYKILQRHAYPEIPPRVESYLTPFCEKFVNILDNLIELDLEFKAQIDERYISEIDPTFPPI
jgi:DNA-binding HxlR family transcriptional regulator